MAINANHPFEDLDGIKCSVVEKNCSQQRVDFLKKLLEFNHYKVVVAKSPPPKTAPKPVVAPGSETIPATESIPAAPETFTIGVDNLMFNSTNAIFGRSLHTPDGHVVTLAYWHQQEAVSHDEVPYYEAKI